MADDIWAGCPSAETLAMWCERKLMGAQKLRLESHLVRCDRCRHIVIEVCSAIDGDVCVDRKRAEVSH